MQGVCDMTVITLLVLGKNSLDVALLIVLQSWSKREGWEKNPGEGEQIREIKRLEKQERVKIERRKEKEKKHREIYMNRDIKEMEK